MLGCISILLLSATLVDARQVASGDFIGQRVSIRGVVSAAVRDDIDDGFNWVLLKTPEGTVCASTDNRVHSLEELLPLLDADVELTGTVQRFTHWRKFLGCQMLFDNVAEGDSIKVITPASEDPFSAQPLTNASCPHRQTTTGTVVAMTGESFFLRHNEGLLRVRPVDPNDVPHLGGLVTVSGFIEQNQFIPLMTGALWRTEPAKPARPESATDITADDLFRTDPRSHSGGSFHRYVNMDISGKTVRLAGRVEYAARESRGPAGFRIDCSGESVFVDLSGFAPETVSAPRQGAVVSVTGLCLADFDTSGSAIFPRFLGLTIIPRTPEDLQIIRRAPFWTIARLALMLALAVLVAVGFAVWSAALKVVSTRRGRELAREQIRGARAELKVEERTRLAVELHDSISQVLTGVALQIDAASGADGKGAKKFLSTARNMLASCREELNGCLWDLRSRTFEEKDMTEAVQRTLAPHVGSAKLAVRFNVPREMISEATAHAVLRIVRELGTNAVKHGHAKNIKIAGEFHSDTISFSVLDDGCGFDPAEAPGPAQGHFGLQGVRERLNAFNGTIHCDSEPGCGAKFTVVLHTSPSEEK